MPRGDFSTPVDETYRKSASAKFASKKSRTSKAPAESLLEMVGRFSGRYTCDLYLPDRCLRRTRAKERQSLSSSLTSTSVECQYSVSSHHAHTNGHSYSNWKVISERSPSEYHKQKVYQYTAPEYMNEVGLLSLALEHPSNLLTV